MTDRMEVERLIGELHGARVRGDLAGMCRTFREDGQFRIAGARDGKPISIVAPSLRATAGASTNASPSPGETPGASEGQAGSSRCARSSAAGPQGSQSTGFSACWRR